MTIKHIVLLPFKSSLSKKDIEKIKLSLAELKIYLEHPAHIKVAQEMVLPALIDGVNSPIVFDYQMDE